MNDAIYWKQRNSFKGYRNRTLADPLPPSTSPLVVRHVLNQSLEGHGRADNHQDEREEEDEPIEELNSAASLLAEERKMHPSGEDEGGDVIREVSDHRQDIAKVRYEVSHDGDDHNLEDSPENVDRAGDEHLTLGDLTPVSLDHFVDGLHPERESTNDGDDHEQIDGISNPSAIRKRLDDIIHNLVS